MPKKPSPLKKLETLPPTYDSYEWADYIELLCLANKDGRVSKADVLDFVRERKRDLNEGHPLEGSEAEEKDIEDEMEVEDEYEDDEDIDEETPEPALADDKWDIRGSDWFRHLEYRSGAFVEFYPFRVIKGGTVLVLSGSKARLSVQRKLYIFLLLASNLRYLSQSDQTSIASIFEVASFHALETYLPSGSNLYMFGKHGLNKSGPYSSGTLWEKLNRIAADIREKVVCKKSDFKPSNTGDAGLDLIAWLPLEIGSEMRRGFFVVFGQCACTRRWVEKQFETSYDTWKNYLSFTVYPTRLTFIPYCFRKATGSWHDYNKISATVVVDRLRLTNLLRGKHSTLRPHIIAHVNDVLQNAVFTL
ncbi:MAG: hypothetical protein WBP93_02795 [Pyrinomonadaceae bacterium]